MASDLWCNHVYSTKTESCSGEQRPSAYDGDDAADFYDNVCALCRWFGNLLDTEQHLVGYSAKIYHV